MEERERRLRQERERRERERVVRAKVAASAFARGYLSGIIGSVFQTLQDTGAVHPGLLALGERCWHPCLTRLACRSPGLTSPRHAKPPRPPPNMCEPQASLWILSSARSLRPSCPGCRTQRQPTWSVPWLLMQSCSGSLRTQRCCLKSKKQLRLRVRMPKQQQLLQPRPRQPRQQPARRLPSWLRSASAPATC